MGETELPTSNSQLMGWKTCVGAPARIELLPGAHPSGYWRATGYVMRGRFSRQNADSATVAGRLWADSGFKLMIADAGSTAELVSQAIRWVEANRAVLVALVTTNVITKLESV